MLVTKNRQKKLCFSLIERVILSAGATLIFSLEICQSIESTRLEGGNLRIVSTMDVVSLFYMIVSA